MKTDVEQLDPTRVRLTVQVPFAELEQEFAAAYRTLGGQISVPGFRPGRVPRQVIDARLGRGAVLEQVINEALPRLYAQAVEESEAPAVGQPEIDLSEISDGEQFTFTADVDVKPEFTLPGAAGLAVTVPPSVVSEADVEAELDSLRDRFATLIPVDRAAADGDSVRIDLRAERDGKLVPGGEATGQSFVVGRDSMIDGLEDAVRGLSAGESKTFQTRLVGDADDAAPADVTVTVSDVRERQLPELDDAFAELASQFDTMAELRADTRERLTRIAQQRQLAQARDEVLTAYLAGVDMTLPEHTVEHEVEHRKDAVLQEVQRFGMTRSDYLRGIDMDEESWDADIRERSRRAIKSDWVLDSLAEAQQVSVAEEELTQLIARRAFESGVAPDAYAQELMDPVQMTALVREVARNKALAELVRSATVTDSDGNVVDIAALEATVSGASSDTAGQASAGDESSGIA